MKKFMIWLYAVSIIVFIFDWTFVGIKLLNGDYDIQAGVYVALVCVFGMLAYIIYRIATNKCPHCEKSIWQSKVKYCPHCGKEIAQ